MPQTADRRSEVRRSRMVTERLHQIEAGMKDLHAALDELTAYLERLVPEDQDTARFGWRVQARRLRARECEG